MSFQCPSQKTNGSPGASTLHLTPPQPQSQTAGQWNSGEPQIWCPYHQAWGAHHPHECRKRGRGPLGMNGNAPPPPPTPPPYAGSAAPQGWHMEVRELLAECLPDAAHRIRLPNCQHGIKLTFRRDTTTTDMDWVRANVTGLTRVYTEGKVLVFGLTNAATQRATHDRLKTLRDGDKPITVDYLGDAPTAVVSGLNLGTAGLRLAPAPTTPPAPPAPSTSDTPPDASGMDVDITDRTETRFQKIEKDITRLSPKIDHLDSRIGSMANDIVKPLNDARHQDEAARADRVERTDPETPLSKRPATGAAASPFLSRPDGLACPDLSNLPLRCSIIRSETKAITMVRVGTAPVTGADGQPYVAVVPMDQHGVPRPEFGTMTLVRQLFTDDDATKYQAGLNALNA